MLLDKYGIKLYIREVFSIILCGVEDSVENYQTFHYMFCGYCVRVLWNPIFFSFVTHISISLMIFMLNYAFTHIFFNVRTSLGCRNV